MRDLIVPIKLATDDARAEAAQTAELVLSLRLVTEDAVLTIPVELAGKRIKSIEIPAGQLFQRVAEQGWRAKQAAELFEHLGDLVDARRASEA